MLTVLSTSLPNYKDQFKQLVKVLYQLEEVKFDADIARALGVDKSNVTQILTGKRQISKKMVDRLVNAFPSLNDYIVDMNVKKPVLTHNVATDILPHQIKNHNIQVTDLQREGGYPVYHFMPVFDLSKISQSSTEFYKKRELILFHYSLPDFNDCEIIITMDGDDMARLFQPNDKLLLHPRPDLEEIVFGKPHFVVTKTLMIVRYIHPSNDPAIWILKAENPRYPDIPIKVSKVDAVFQVKGHVNRN